MDEPSSDIRDSGMSDNEHAVGQWLDRPYVTLVLGVVVLLMLIFLAGKAGFSLWLMQKLNIGERLVNEAGEPDFWTVTKTLETYQRPAAAPQQTVKRQDVEVAKGKEHFDPRILAAL